MAPYDPLQRVTPRPERPHMPFEIGRRNGPLFRSTWAMLAFTAVVGGALAGLTIGAVMLGLINGGG